MPGGAAANGAAHAQNVFVTQVLGIVEARSCGSKTIWVIPVVVAQVDEDQSAVVAPPIDPAVELDRLRSSSAARNAAHETSSGFYPSPSFRVSQCLFDARDVKILLDQIARELRSGRRVCRSIRANTAYGSTAHADPSETGCHPEIELYRKIRMLAVETHRRTAGQPHLVLLIAVSTSWQW